MLNELEALRYTAKRLKENPIYALTLGSRELFHSNFLHWLFSYRPDSIEAVLGQRLSKPEIMREKYNIDLVLVDQMQKQVIAVENKVKDTPKEDQLDIYSVTLAQNYSEKGYQVKKILLSLIAATFELNDGWQTISYAELGERIAALPRQSNDRIEAITSAYAEMVKDLAALADSISNRDKLERLYWFQRDGVANTREIDKIVEDIRFGDTLQKHRAAKLLHDIEKAIRNSADLFDVKVSLKHGLTNKTPFAEAWIERQLDGRELRLGLQIQGEQYRRFLLWKPFDVINDLQEKHGRLKIFIDQTDKNRWLFGTNHDSNGILSATGYFTTKGRMTTNLRQKTPYCSYAPNFIYQYINISKPEKNTNLHPEELPHAVVADLMYATTLLDDPNYTNRFERWKQ
jgi:hypothetical protein